MTDSADVHDAWKRIHPLIRGALQQEVRLLSELFGSQLQSVTVFGEALADDFNPREHTASSVLVLERIDLAALRRLAEHGVRLGRASIAAPLILTNKDIRDSLDSFPLEFLEIQQQEVTVVGEDRFAGLSLEPGYVRLQCERELKGLLTGLRSSLLASTGRTRYVQLIERDAAFRLLRTLRGMLWLKGKRDFVPRSKVFAGMETVMGRPLTGLRAAFALDGRHDWDEFDRLYGDVEAIMEACNAF